MPEQDGPAVGAADVVTPADMRVGAGRPVPGSLGLVLGEAPPAFPAHGDPPADRPSSDRAPAEEGSSDRAPVARGSEPPRQSQPIDDRRRLGSYLAVSVGRGPLLVWGSLVEPPLVLRSGHAVVRVLAGYDLLSPVPSLASGRIGPPRRRPSPSPAARARLAAPAPPQPFAASALERTPPGSAPSAASSAAAAAQDEATGPGEPAPPAETGSAKPSARKFRLPRSVGELAGSVPPPPQVG